MNANPTVYVYMCMCVYVCMLTEMNATFVGCVGVYVSICMYTELQAATL